MQPGGCLACVWWHTVTEGKGMLEHCIAKLGQQSLQAGLPGAETAGTYSGVLAERAAKGTLVAGEAELPSEEQSYMGSLSGWQALADQVCLQASSVPIKAWQGKPCCKLPSLPNIETF